MLLSYLAETLCLDIQLPCSIDYNNLNQQIILIYNAEHELIEIIYIRYNLLI